MITWYSRTANNIHIFTTELAKKNGDFSKTDDLDTFWAVRRGKCLHSGITKLLIYHCYRAFHIPLGNGFVLKYQRLPPKMLYGGKMLADGESAVEELQTLKTVPYRTRRISPKTTDPTKFSSETTISAEYGSDWRYHENYTVWADFTSSIYKQELLLGVLGTLEFWGRNLSYGKYI